MSFRSLLVVALVSFVGCKKEEAPPPPTPTPAPPADSKPAPPAKPLPTQFGKVKGKVLFEGQAPAMPDMKDRILPDGKPRMAECPGNEKEPYVRVGTGGGLRDVVVRLPVGAAVGAVPAEPALVDQKNCLYTPFVVAVMEGGKIAFRNSDPAMHNIHLEGEQGTLINAAQQPGDKDLVKKVTPNGSMRDVEAKAGEVVLVKCDVHPWMKALMVVIDHPYFATTGEDGTFTFSAPVGKHKVEAWHPYLGTREAEVEVTENGEATVTFAAYKPEDYKEPR